MIDLIQNAFKKYFLLGLIIVIPFAVTVKVLFYILQFFDDILAVHNGHFLYILPESIHPDQLLGIRIPFLGFFGFVVMTFFFGVISKHYLGRRLIYWGDKLMDKIPMARVIYNLVKQTIDTYVHRDRNQFSRVVMIEYPRPGLKTLAFVTGTAPDLFGTNEPMLNIYVPTTPNPTSGFYLVVAEKDVRDVDLSVEEAFKLIVSFGMVTGPKHVEEG